MPPVALLLTLLLALAGHALAQSPAAWLEPIAPFRLADNVHYVGSRGLASYLFTTPEGHILLNSNLESSVPQIRASVEKLGLKFSDIRILLISHAHWDHDAGSAAIKQQTGAKYLVMEQDVRTVETGGRADPVYGHVPTSLYPPTKVDRVLHDGDEVKLGHTVLIARLTAGHTPGCTTWTFKATDAGRTYDAVIIGSPNVNDGYKLVNNTAYPSIATDYERTFRLLKSLPCDLFLGAHGDYFNLEQKLPRLSPGEKNPFIDPAGYQKYVENRAQAFRQELTKQQGK